MSSTIGVEKAFEFLLGTWHLDYNVPKSDYSEAADGSGEGVFRRALSNRFVFFDYTFSLTTGNGAAHAVFGWDEKTGVVRYWWFEDSGVCMTAVGRFLDENTLFLSWQDSLLVQTFRRDGGPDRVILRMSSQDTSSTPKLVLEVILTRL